ncbi:MAG: leucine-rich repeat protein [Eubacteriales bacterium]|nr:leucine-rich repeat protein [Eubacteriales bacterium]
MKKLSLLLIFALFLTGCGQKEAPVTDPPAPTVEIVASRFSAQETRQRYLGDWGVDIGQYQDAVLHYDGRTYRFFSPTGALGYTARDPENSLGRLVYDPSAVADDLTTDRPEWDDAYVWHVTGGACEDGLLLDAGLYCTFLFTAGEPEEGPRYDYTENGDGTITITRYYGTQAHLAVPSEIDGKKVTAIGDVEDLGAFSYRPSLVTVTLPEGVETLSSFTFDSSYRLETVYFPSTLKEVGHAVFNNCPVLTALYFEGPAPAHGNRVVDQSVDGLDLENPRQWYPKGLDPKDVKLYYHENTLGWAPQDWEFCTKIPY